MTAAEKIFSLLNNAASNQQKYCLFCLRTELERRLVKPEFFIKCLKFYKPMKFCLPISMDTDSICFVCNQELQRALRMLQAMDFALAVQSCLNELQDTVWDFDHFYSSVNKNIELRDGLMLSNVWNEVRFKNVLTTTEILQVTSDPPTTSQQTQTLLDPNAVVVIEDEESPLSSPGLPRLVEVTQFLANRDPHLATALQSKMILMARPGAQSEKILIHKMEARNGKIYVPSLKAQLEFNALVHSDCDGLIPEEPRIYIPKEVQVEKTARNKKQVHEKQKTTKPRKEKSNPNKLIRVNNFHTIPMKEVSKTYGNKKSQTPGSDDQIYDPGKKIEPKSTSPNNAKMPRFSFETDDDDPLKPNSKGETSDFKGGSSNLEGGSSNSKGGSSNSTGGSGNSKEGSINSNKGNSNSMERSNAGFVPSKEAVMSGKVDWEDKIPMDVISFMDATDPNPDPVFTSQTSATPQTDQSTTVILPTASYSENTKLHNILPTVNIPNIIFPTPFHSQDTEMHILPTNTPNSILQMSLNAPIQHTGVPLVPVVFMPTIENVKGNIVMENAEENSVENQEAYSEKRGKQIANMEGNIMKNHKTYSAKKRKQEVKKEDLQTIVIDLC